MSEEVTILEETKPSKKVVTLSERASAKLDRWFEQINAKKKVKLSRKEFVNWLIERSPDSLSSTDLNSIAEKYYDHVAHLNHLLREAKKSKLEGSGEVGVEVIVRAKREKKEQNATDVSVESPSPSLPLRGSDTYGPNDNQSDSQ
jgi:hypothetical protein